MGFRLQYCIVLRDQIMQEVTGDGVRSQYEAVT